MIRFFLGDGQVIGTGVAVAHLSQTHRPGHVLQFAVPVGRTGQTVERVIGNVEPHP